MAECEMCGNDSACDECGGNCCGIPCTCEEDVLDGDEDSDDTAL